MPSIEIEIDEYQIQRAVSDALDESDFETKITDAVVEGFDDSDLVSALTAIRDRLDSIDEKVKEPEPHEPPEPEPFGGFYGFRPGEKVILFNSLHPSGLRATVDAKYTEYGKTWTNVIPVVRDDTKTKDLFPVQQTILSEPLDAFLESRVGAVVEQARTEILNEPTGDPTAWNLKATEEAIEDQIGLEFVYRTPAPSYISGGQDSEKLRRFRPSSIDRMGPEDRQSIIRGYDLDAQDVRAFRIDRIKGYVKHTSGI